MVFRITFTKRRASRAFTLVDALIGIAISGIAFAALASFTLYCGKSLAGMVNYVDMEQKSQLAIDTMSREIRNCLSLTAYETNAISLRCLDGTRLTYSWSPDSKALVRVKDGEVTRPLLKQCDYLRFAVWQRTPINGTWDNYSSSSITNAKLVNVSWKCSRRILGVAMNTESVQTSKIVIRNK